MFHPILIENYRKLKKFPCSFTELQTTYRHPPLVWLISGHQQVMDLLVVHFKVAHLYMTFDLKYDNPKGSLDATIRKKKDYSCAQSNLSFCGVFSRFKKKLTA